MVERGNEAPISPFTCSVKCSSCSRPAGPFPAPGRGTLGSVPSLGQQQPGVLASATPSWLLNGPDVEVEVMGDAVLEASHNVQGCGCSWVSHSGQGVGPEAEGAGSPQGLGHGSGGWAARRCHCLSVTGAAAASGCPKTEEAAWGEILREGLSSPCSCSPGGPLAGWAGPGWWHRGSHC